MGQYEWHVSRIPVQNGALATRTLNGMEDEDWEIVDTGFVAGTGEFEGKTSMYIVARKDLDAGRALSPRKVI
jgi:hypothetical protein